LTARFAVTDDVVVLGDLQNGFRVLALLAKNKLLNETVEVVLKLGGLMSTVNDPTVIGWVGLDLRSQLETEVFDDIFRLAGKSASNTAQVDDDTLDSVSLSFNLRLERLHLVTIERIGDVATDVN